MRVTHVPFIPNSLSLFTTRKYLKQRDPRALSPLIHVHIFSEFLHSYKMGRITSCWIWISWKRKFMESMKHSGKQDTCALPSTATAILPLYDKYSRLLCDSISQFTA